MKRRLIFTFLISFLASVLLATLAFEVLTAGLRNAHKDFQGKLNYILNGTDHFDIVFMGASRVHDGINPILFDSLLQTHSYNAGIEGAGIAEISVFMKKYIKSHGAPRYLFLGLDEAGLVTVHIWDFPRMFPYVYDDDIFSLHIYQGEMLLAKYLPPIAVSYYDDSRKTLALQSFIAGQQPYPYASTRGYQALYPKPHPPLQPASTEEYYYTSDGLAKLGEVCRFCQSKHIQLILVFPPKLITDKLVGAKPDSYLKITGIVQAYGVPIIDIGHLHEFTDPSLYYDGAHLISTGADEFTRLVAEEFKNLK